MSWKNNISEGFKRISIVVGVICAIFSAALSWGISNGNIFYTIVFGILGYAAGYSLIALINWIINGFIGKK